MAPAVAAALISAAPAALKGVQGLFQSAKGAKLAKRNIRPTYEIPKEFQQNFPYAAFSRVLGCHLVSQGFPGSENPGV